MKASATTFTPTSLLDTMRVSIALRKLCDLRLPVCRGVLRVLAHHGELKVSDICDKLSSSPDHSSEQSVVSYALGILRKHEVVHLRKADRCHYYSINGPAIARINAATAAFASSDPRPGQRR